MTIVTVLLLLLPTLEFCYTQTFTLMDKYESTVSLNPNIWKPHGKLHFKMMSNGDDGTVFTIVNHKDDKMVLEILNGRYKLKFDNKEHIIPGLTNVQINTERWSAIKIHQYRANLKVHVDHVTVILPLTRRRHWLVENWKEITFGLKQEENGLNPSKSIVGCVELESIRNSTILDDYADHVHAISTTCIDACAIQSCDHGGICLNRFNNALCDCRGTGYKGTSCENEATSVKFDGSSYMNFNMEDSSIINKKIDHIRMRFKTSSQEGLLLHMITDEMFLMIELHNSSMHIISSLNEGIFQMNIGDNLHDNQWHHVHFSRKLNYIETRLDDQLHLKAIIEDKNDHVMFKNSKKLRITFGGVSSFNSISHSKSKQNFYGCFQQIYLDQHDVIDKVLYGNDLSYTKEGDITTCNTPS